jgi:hypothetical protein
MLVPYDEDFDMKVEAGADALLERRGVPQALRAAERPQALQDARLVLLAATAAVAYRNAQRSNGAAQAAR